MAKDNPSALGPDLVKALGCLAYDMISLERFKEAE